MFFGNTSSCTDQAVRNRNNIERLSHQVSAVLSLVTALVASLVIIARYVPGDISEYADVFRADLLRHCKPENDLTAYAAFVLIYPVCYVIFIRLFGRLFEAVNPDKLSNASESINTLWSICISVFAICGTSLLYATPRYSVHIYGVDKLPLVALCTVLLLAMCHAYNKGKLRTFVQSASAVISLSFLIFVFYAVSRYDYSATELYHNLHHYNAWWFPIYKVGSGMTIGTDFTNLYGFYPYLVVPVLKLLGGVNQHSLSLYMAFVFTLMAACLIGFCGRFFKNKLLGTICAIGAFALGPIKFLHYGKTYFQYYPSRILFVFLVLGLIALYSTFKKARPIFKVVGILIVALSLVWNIESGLVAAIIWAGYLVLEKATDHRLTDPALIKRIAFAVISTLVSVLLAVCFIEAVTYLRTGSLLSIDIITYGITVFAGLGFYMIPIKPHLWILIAAAFAYGLYVSIPNLALAKRKNSSPDTDKDFTTALFIISITGTGCFMYFMGRTHPETCMTFTPWAVIVCALLAERNLPELERIKNVKAKKKFQLFAKRSGIALRNLVCFGIAGITMTAGVSVIFDVANKNSEVNTKFLDEQPALVHLSEQFSDWAETDCNGETPNILIYYSVLVQELMGLPAEETVTNQPSWFYYSDIHTYIDYIKSHSDEVFIIDSKAVNNLSKYFPEEWEEIVNTFTLCRTTSAKLHGDKKEITEYYLYVPDLIIDGK